MVADPVFFSDLVYVFLAAVLGVALARLAGQALILGCVVGGVFSGPFTPGPSFTDAHTFDLFAEIGVILLMYSVGIEFSLRDLLRVKWVALLGGPLGTAALTQAVGLSLSLALGAFLAGLLIGNSD